MATKKIHLTQKNVEAVVPPIKGRDTYADDTVPGLRLRVTANGTKSFVLVKKARGQTLWVTLGQFPIVSVSEARRGAVEQTISVAKGGKSDNNRILFQTLFSRYMEGHSKLRKKTWAKDERAFDLYLKRLAPRPVSDITTEEIQSLHAKIGSKHGRTTSNRVLALLKKVFNFGRRTLKLRMENPCVGVEMFKERSRERFLDADELSRLFTVLNDEETPEQWRDFFKLALLTGARRSNIESMRWKDINLPNGVWVVPGEFSKNDEPLQIVLEGEALEILSRRKLASDGESPYVFPSCSKQGHIVEPKKAWANILKKARLEDVRIHDLRRTLGSWMAAGGTSLHIIGKTLGHQSQDATKVYARLNLDPVRSAVKGAQQAMMEAVKAGNTKEG